MNDLRCSAGGRWTIAGTGMVCLGSGDVLLTDFELLSDGSCLHICSGPSCFHPLFLCFPLYLALGFQQRQQVLFCFFTS